MKRELKELLKKSKFKLIIEFVALVLFVYLCTVPTKYLGIIIDMLADIEQNQAQIINGVLLMLLATVGVVVVRMIFKYLDFNMQIGWRKTLYDHLFKKILKIKLEDINATKNGEIMSYFVRDVNKTCRTLFKFFSAGVRVLASAVIVGTLMAQSSNLKLTICALIPMIITVISLVFIRKKIRRNFFVAQKSFTDLSEFVQENTDSIRTVKAFSGEETEMKNFEIKNEKLRKDNLKVTYFEGLLDVLINVGMGISYAIAIIWGGNLVLAGEMSVGDIVAFMGYLAVLEMPIRYLPWIISRYDEVKISINRLEKVFSLPEEKLKLDKVSNEHISGDIKINNLTFHYPDGIDEVLSNISLEIKQGETLGIIGVIGSGKTTLMNLLLKLYYVKPGIISIGGKDINEIPTEKLRNSICYITQDNFLFSTTLKENINLFKDEYKDEEIIESTKKSMIYNEIQEMEDGIETIIGEKGIDLSGGQKQRVVLSRAFLNNSDIVVFDDTFSALDNRTEQHVLNNIKSLVNGKTCIIISNRISDIKDCKTIIVMEQGKIIEQGNHKSLLKEKGKYYKFYQGQAHKVEELI